MAPLKRPTSMRGGLNTQSVIRPHHASAATSRARLQCPQLTYTDAALTAPRERPDPLGEPVRRLRREREAQ